MSISNWIASRIRLKGDRQGSGVSIGIAVGGVALCVIIMEITLAVVVGFKDGIRNKLLGFNAEISVLAVPSVGDEHTAAVDVTPQLSNIISRTLENARTEMTVKTPGLLKTDSDFEGAIYIGADPYGDHTFAIENLREGQWPFTHPDSARNEIVISRTMASALGLETGDKVYSTYFVQGDVKMRRHRIAGIYESDFGEYDKTVVYASMAGLQGVLGLDSLQCTSLDIRGIPQDEIAEDAMLLREELVKAYADGCVPGYLTVDTVERSGAMYFNWLSLLDTNVAVIFVLMLAVAGFTLVSCLFILVLERVRMIGVLRALGMRSGDVRRIFLLLAMRVVGIGMIIGNVVGLGFLLLQQHCRLIPLDPEMYFLSYVPVHINIFHFVLLNIGIAVASWLILVLPSRVVSSVRPAEAIQYD